MRLQASVTGSVIYVYPEQLVGILDQPHLSNLWFVFQ